MSGGTRIPDGPPERPGTEKSQTEKPRTFKKQAEKPESPVSSGRQPGSGKAAKSTISVTKQDNKPQKPLKGSGGNPSPASAQKAGISIHGNKLPPSSPLPANSINQDLSSKNLTPNSPVNPGERTVLAGELFRQIAHYNGFPADTLSLTLLAFCRFFSFSPDKTLIGTLRRELLAAGRASSPKTAKEKALLEAEALAAIVSRDKGVILSPEALEYYAGFLGTPVSETKARQDPGRKTEGTKVRGIPTAEELRAIAEEQSEKNNFLNLMNSLPGKNGQHWLVFPFDINIGGTDLRVFLRILIKEQFLSEKGEYIIADIVGPKRQWRCYLEKIAGKLKADIRVFPELSPKALNLLKKEAERFLGAGSSGISGGFGEILVQNGEKTESWAEDLCSKSLPSVCNEV